MTLYEIDREILACLDMETGEITDAERLDALQIERDIKLENTALYIKNLIAEADAIKAEEKILAERRKAKENKAESLKQYLSGALSGAKFETAKVNISFRKSEKVEIANECDLLVYLETMGYEDCIKYKTPEIQLTPVKKLLKEGLNLPGVTVAEKQNIQIK
jgi:hypothetical protein